jgi:signal peptide peptidase SppA
MSETSPVPPQFGTDPLNRRGSTPFTGGPWFLSEPRIRDLAERSRITLAGDSVPPPRSSFAGDDPDDYPGVPAYCKAGGVARIPLVGIMTKYPSWADDYLGLCPTEAVRACFTDALADSTVRQIVLVIDSPGGVVNGTVELAYAVRAASKVKPVTAVISGSCCSAGYYVASQCGKVLATPASEIGCIGVYCVLTDTSGAAAQLGIKRVLVSSGGVKGLGADGQVVDAQVAEQQAMVNAIAAQFVADVAQGRGLSPAAVSQMADGRAWLADVAVQMKLVDGVVPGVDAAVAAARAIATAAASRQAAAPKPAKKAVARRPEEPSAAAIAMKEWEDDPVIRKCYPGVKGKLNYAERREAEAKADALVRQLAARPGVSAADQAADEWRRNVGGCRDRFASAEVYRATRCRQLGEAKTLI